MHEMLRNEHNTTGVYLKPGFKEKWVAALRSGEYTQGMGYLHIINFPHLPDTTNLWCCAGVAADVLDKSGEKILRQESEEEEGVESFNSCDSVLPDTITHLMFEPSNSFTWSDFNSAISVIMNRLMAANDNSVPFLDIADWIEREL